MKCTRCGKTNQDNAEICYNCGSFFEAKNGASDGQLESERGVSIVPKRNRILAVIWLAGPLLLLIFSMMLWAAIVFFANAQAIGESKTIDVLQKVLGIVVLVGSIGSIAGIPIAIVLMRRRELDTEHSYDSRSGNGPRSEFPEELRGWNWGSAGLTLFWGVYHSVWLSLLHLVPYVNNVWWIVMGIKGNEWAWASQKWQSVDEFRRSQGRWNTWGVVFFFLPLVFVVAILTLIGAVSGS